MLTIDEIRDLLQDRIVAVVSEKTGINRNTLAKLRSGEATTASTRTINTLSEYLGRLE